MRSAHTQILAAIALLLVITAATETRAGTVTWSETRRGDPVDCAPGQQTCVQNLGAANLPADGSLNYGPLSFGNGGGRPE